MQPIWTVVKASRSSLKKQPEDSPISYQTQDRQNTQSYKYVCTSKYRDRNLRGSAVMTARRVQRCLFQSHQWIHTPIATQYPTQEEHMTQNQEHSMTISRPKRQGHKEDKFPTKHPNAQAKPLSCRIDQATDLFISSMLDHFHTSRSNVIRACIRSIRNSANPEQIIRRFL